MNQRKLVFLQPCDDYITVLIQEMIFNVCLAIMESEVHIMKKLTLILLSLILVAGSVDAKVISLYVNQINITKTANPVIRDNRTLVPIRFVGDALQASTDWDENQRTVTIKKGDREVKLWIDSRLVELNGGDQYMISDVAPTIIADRTYVPLRLVGNVFSVAVSWDQGTSSVHVNSDQQADLTPYYDLAFVDAPDTITETTKIHVAQLPAGGVEAKLLILDQKTGMGYVRARSTTLSELTWVPRADDKGNKVMVYAIYNASRELVAAAVKPVVVELKPEVHIDGISEGQVYDKITIGQHFNFQPRYVNYKLVNLETSNEIVVSERDPLGTYTYVPTYEKNGQYEVTVSAFDAEGNRYDSDPVQVGLSVSKYLNLKGVSEGKTVSGPISLIASRNFDVTNTQYILEDGKGQKIILSSQGWGSYAWFPDEQYQGAYKAYVQVTDTKGKQYESTPINIIVDGSPKLLLKGVGPNQVLTGEATLSVTSNVIYDNLKFHILQPDGSELVLAGDNEVIFSPTQTGTTEIYATATYGDVTLQTSHVELRSYLEKTYGSKAIVAKDQFLGLVSSLAEASHQATGMSASLQTAQAILETGWGQYVPVDKYSGLFSYNLFGIKGKATNGSVISNTWEVYNGVTYRVDAGFRAYYNLEESWADHKRILLDLSRYAPYREVMYDSTLGAFAIRRCGYATDPKYPMKLIKIIDRYNLETMDETTI